MRDTTALAAAIRRLEAAVGAVEGAATRVLAARRTGADHESEIALLSDDRARMAEELDVLNARASRLETVNRDVARRLDTAMETIRDVLSEQPHA